MKRLEMSKVITISIEANNSKNFFYSIFALFFLFFLLSCPFHTFSSFFLSVFSYLHPTGILKRIDQHRPLFFFTVYDADEI